MDTATEQVKLPEVKVAKIRLAAASLHFDPGRKESEIHELQVLRGLLQFGCVACPAFLLEIVAISRLLGTCEPTRQMARPWRSPTEFAQVWREFWEGET